MQFNTLTGTPRSGSTLLANILNQHPDVGASSTSGLPDVLLALSTVLTTNTAVTSDLITDSDAGERHINIGNSVIDNWHAPSPVIVDKNRAWAGLNGMLHTLRPDAWTIVLVRDPRDILASIQKQHEAC